jgi:hypothetical protein
LVERFELALRCVALVTVQIHYTVQSCVRVQVSRLVKVCVRSRCLVARFLLLVLLCDVLLSSNERSGIMAVYINGKGGSCPDH